MSVFVVDVSVVVKWMLPEPLTANAVRLQTPSHQLRAPSFMDCMYLALAVRLGGQMVTADERLVNSLATTSWAASAIHLQDLP